LLFFSEIDFFLLLPCSAFYDVNFFFSDFCWALFPPGNFFSSNRPFIFFFPTQGKGLPFFPLRASFPSEKCLFLLPPPFPLGPTPFSIRLFFGEGRGFFPPLPLFFVNPIPFVVLFLFSKRRAGVAFFFFSMGRVRLFSFSFLFFFFFPDGVDAPPPPPLTFRAEAGGCLPRQRFSGKAPPPFEEPSFPLRKQTFVFFLQLITASFVSSFLRRNLSFSLFLVHAGTSSSGDPFFFPFRWR